MNVYGSRNHEKDELKDLVAAAVGIAFDPHEGMFRCGEYWRYEANDDALVVIQDNCIDEHGDLAEAGFPDHGVLLYVEADLDETPLQRMDGLELLETRD